MASCPAQALLAQQKALRQPAALSVARLVLQDLQQQGWLLPAGQGDASTDPAASDPSAVEAKRGLYVSTIASLSVKGAITADWASGSSSGPTPWLRPAVASLCSSLAALPGRAASTWAQELALEGGTRGVVFAAQACHAQGLHLALLDLVRAQVRTAGAQPRAKVSLNPQP